jgi:hypothetical protein
MNQFQQQTSLAVKLALDGQVRRIRINRDSTYEQLQLLVRSSFPSLATSGFVLKFLDDEDELCTICSDVEFSEAMDLTIASLKPSLKIFLERSSLAPVVEPASVETPTPAPVKPVDDQKHEVDDHKHEESATQPQAAQEPGSAPSNHAPMNKERIVTMAIDFLQDASIVTVLPGAIHFFVSRVGDCVDEKSAEQVLMDLFNEFPVMAAHPLTGSLSSADCPHRARLLAKMIALAPHQQSLVEFLPRLLDILPQLIQTLSTILAQSLNNMEQAGAHVHKHIFAPLIGLLMPIVGPLMCSMKSGRPSRRAHQPPTGMTDVDGKGVHTGIHCDGCQQAPIVGPRFKCQVCPDYDLCGTCEAKNEHPADHTLLKMRVPHRTDIHYGVQCDGCQVQPIVGARFKCKTCPNFDLCATCEAKNEHPQDHALLKLRVARKGPRGRGRCGGKWANGRRGRGRGAGAGIGRALFGRRGLFGRHGPMMNMFHGERPNNKHVATPTPAVAPTPVTPAAEAVPAAEPEVVHVDHVDAKEVHLGIWCDECKQKPIVGPRFKCNVCPDYDLCGTCHSQCAHNMHPVTRTAVKEPAQGVTPDQPEEPQEEEDLDAPKPVVSPNVDVPEPEAQPEPEAEVASVPAAEPEPMESEHPYASQLAVLETMGFHNRGFNENLLAAFEGDLGRAVNYLVSGPQQRGPLPQ